MPLPEHKRSTSVHVATRNGVDAPAVWRLLRRQHQTWHRPLVFHAEATLKKATLEWKRLVVVVVVVMVVVLTVL